MRSEALTAQPFLQGCTADPEPSTTLSPTLGFKAAWKRPGSACSCPRGDESPRARRQFAPGLHLRSGGRESTSSRPRTAGSRPSRPSSERGSRRAGGAPCARWSGGGISAGSCRCWRPESAPRILDKNLLLALATGCSRGWANSASACGRRRRRPRGAHLRRDGAVAPEAAVAPRPWPRPNRKAAAPSARWGRTPASPSRARPCTHARSRSRRRTRSCIPLHP